MKIRTRLTLRYLFVSALLVIFVFFILEESLFPQDGYDMLRILDFKLIIIWILTFATLFTIGYYMAQSVLKPVSEIIRQVEKITASKLSKRVVVGNNNDEISELANTFNNTLERLEKSFETQRTFIGNVSHELRTPMAALIAELEIALNRERSNDEYREVIINVLDDAKKIEERSCGLLDLGKASYNTDQIDMSPVRPDEVLLDAMNMILRANPKYKIDINIEEPNDNNINYDSLISVTGNEYLLRTAFVNLIDNNCKFSTDSASDINLSYTDTTVIIKFKDNGIGIPQQDIDNLFTPFFRGANRTYAQGNGIGLTLVEKIIRLHNGEIRIRSYVNEGTEFTIYLPCGR